MFYTKLFSWCGCTAEDAFDVESLEFLERLDIDALEDAVDPPVIGVEGFFKTVCSALRDSVK